MGKIVNKTQLAEILGVDERTLSRWQKDGLPVIEKIGRENQYDTAKVIEWRIAQEVMGDGDIDYNHERARLTKAQADKAEMEAEELRNNLIPAEKVAQAWGDILAAVRSRIRAIPTKIAHKLTTIRKTAEAEKLLRENIDQALEELSNYEPPTICDDEGDDDAEAAAGSDSKPVGRRKPPVKRGK